MEKIKKRNKRAAPRKNIETIKLSGLMSMDDLTKLAKQGSVKEASATGLLINLKREDLIPIILRRNLNIDILVGHRVMMHLTPLELDLSGVIVRTQFTGKEGGFDIAIDYAEEAPAYWRECLMDYLPEKK